MKIQTLNSEFLICVIQINVISIILYVKSFIVNLNHRSKIVSKTKIFSK